MIAKRCHEYVFIVGSSIGAINCELGNRQHRRHEGRGFHWCVGGTVFYRAPGALVSRRVTSTWRLTSEDIWSRRLAIIGQDVSGTRTKRPGTCRVRRGNPLSTCNEPMIWNGAEWVCAVGHLLKGAYDEDGERFVPGRQFNLPTTEVRRRDLVVDGWYAEATAAFRRPAASNWAHGRVRAKVNRWREGFTSETGFRARRGYV